MALEFADLVREGQDMWGLSRAKAEARARDILFGDGKSHQPPVAPTAASSDIRSPGSSAALAEAGFASMEELWAHIQSTWELRGRGVDLIAVLEQINSYQFES